MRFHISSISALLLLAVVRSTNGAAQTCPSFVSGASLGTLSNTSPYWFHWKYWDNWRFNLFSGWKFNNAERAHIAGVGVTQLECISICKNLKLVTDGSINAVTYKRENAGWFWTWKSLCYCDVISGISHGIVDIGNDYYQSCLLPTSGQITHDRARQRGQLKQLKELEKYIKNEQQTIEKNIVLQENTANEKAYKQAVELLKHMLHQSPQYEDSTERLKEEKGTYNHDHMHQHLLAQKHLQEQIKQEEEDKLQRLYHRQQLTIA